MSFDHPLESYKKKGNVAERIKTTSFFEPEQEVVVAGETGWRVVSVDENKKEVRVAKQRGKSGEGTAEHTKLEIRTVQLQDLLNWQAEGPAH